MGFTSVLDGLEEAVVRAYGRFLATKSRGPWKLIYYEAYTELEDAEGEKIPEERAGRRFLRAQLRHYLRVKASPHARPHASTTAT